MFRILFLFVICFICNACNSSPSKNNKDQTQKNLEESGLHQTGEMGCTHGEDKDECLRRSLKKYNVHPVKNSDFPVHSESKIEVGKMLFFDKVLSGNNDMACATCHHPEGHTADSFSLSAGSGSSGVREQRRVQREGQLVPRHTPSLFNRGHKEFKKMFWDGRVEESLSGNLKFSTPVGDQLPNGLESVLAAQSMFPPTSHVEMRGARGSNQISNFEDLTQVWRSLEQKVLNIQSYRNLLAKAYPNVPSDKLSFVQIANSIAAFETAAFQSVNSPFDQYLSGDNDALSAEQKRGAILFYNKAQCGLCHSGTFQTDHKFYNISSPQFGPGKGDGQNEKDDFGRMKVSKKDHDKYRFKTAPLRNVALTAPYGRTGAFHTLESIVRHKINPNQASDYLGEVKLKLPGWDLELANASSSEYLAALNERKKSDLPPVTLSDEEVYDLVAFLTAFTDTKMRDMTSLTPEQVPSGLVVP